MHAFGKIKARYERTTHGVSKVCGSGMHSTCGSEDAKEANQKARMVDKWWVTWQPIPGLGSALNDHGDFALSLCCDGISKIDICVWSLTWSLTCPYLPPSGPDPPFSIA
ncbi:hypothetical protein BV22DRAFT_289289 [Leucogyrophana mollusca]|uniref:Uncharacterized protein n=1 Tax=Leucogyrophana mollusca TaxID=85980 RepID=A0ACB8BN47_9AGAM|nr:hypothetical protein BV22DRAFT_289289 [Leucogyrophana mollusca]